MIKIQVNENMMEEIEDKHWKWFSETGKKKLESYLEKRGKRQSFSTFNNSKNSIKIS
ncbi:hypothetical protein G7A79_24835, partial [Coprococcus sp. MSK.21.13]|nr:hypothetical protein [Bacteroidales bacterium MSK.15.36]NSJ92327.1 hypothetical protein [Coprococcus sp. MSK.21.13]